MIVSKHFPHFTNGNLNANTTYILKTTPKARGRNEGYTQISWILAPDFDPVAVLYQCKLAFN